MRRSILPILLLAALVTAAPAAAEPPLSIKTTCRTGPTAAERSLTVVSTLSAVPRAQRVRIQYDLQWRKARGGRFRSYPVAPFVRRLAVPAVHDYTVTPLPARAVYRLRVRVRWIKGARVVRRAQRLSDECRQRAPRGERRRPRQPGAGPADG